MPKMKTRKSITKRFKITATGRIKRSKAYRSHIRSKKSPKRKRFLRGKALVSKSDEKKMKRQVLYW